VQRLAHHRLDLRGFGQSSFPEASYAAVDDVSAVLDKLGIERAHVVGNSMGGALAIDFALAHPDRVASITVVASGPNGYPATPEDRARFAADIETIVAAFRAAGEQGLERGAELWKAQPMVVVAHADPRTAPLLHRMIDDNQRIFGMAHWPDDDKRAVGMLARVSAPTLIVGDRDIALVRAAAEYAANGIAGAKLVTIAGTDHLPQMEQPERFNALLLEFLRSR
jgi:pimeloyl-ACP methyl ester carboxylesterase